MAIGEANGSLCNVRVRKAPEGFTLVELLAVIAIIAILVGMLVPAVVVVRRHVLEGATRVEISGLEAAMVSYYQDWGLYPPDDEIDGGAADSAQCLYHYLGTAFRTSDGYTRNGGPYFDFPPDRIVGDRFIDRIGQRAPVDYYQFDNNDDDDGSEAWGAGNISNVHPTGVDIWSPGWDGVDAVSTGHPTRDTLNAFKEANDDIGNW